MYVPIHHVYTGLFTFKYLGLHYVAHAPKLSGEWFIRMQPAAKIRQLACYISTIEYRSSLIKHQDFMHYSILLDPRMFNYDNHYP